MTPLLPPSPADAAAALGGTAYLLGQAMAYVALAMGALFFAYAARYYVGTIAVLLSPRARTPGSSNSTSSGAGENAPMISVHVAMYNEKLVAERLLAACSKMDYPNYEVIVVDDSNDGTFQILKEWVEARPESELPRVKLFHRESREGFKGGALNEALRIMDQRTEYVCVFDADFVPPVDTLRRFLDYFGDGRYPADKLAAVQGYQWHTLNRSENWVTKGVSCEFSGSYMVERTFEELSGNMKMVAGSVYMIRADLLRHYHWSTSITEDWEMTLRLYTDGYRVRYTPTIRAAAECPSTLAKLVRQRMRWAEGHTFNVKKYFAKVMLSSKVRAREKFEFLYFSIYYLQSVILILGTFLWLVSDLVLHVVLPFWGASLGWAMVFTNLLSLPVMSLTGLYLERRSRADFGGILSQVMLVYALAPYQAYAALKGFLESVEGTWVRTPKSGRIHGFPGELKHLNLVRRVHAPQLGAGVLKAGAGRRSRAVIVVGLSMLLVLAFVVGVSGRANAWSSPEYYFYNQAAPAGYKPFSSTAAGTSLMMGLSAPSGSDTSVSIGASVGLGPIYYSPPAPSAVSLPQGGAVSADLWVNATGQGQAGASMSSDFNDQPIPGGDYIWFASVLNEVPGDGYPDGLTVHFVGQEITFTAGGTQYQLPVPNSEVIFSTSATMGTTTFNTAEGLWVTTAPAGFPYETFTSGLAFQVPAAGLPGGIQGVTWSGTFESSQSFTLNWKWYAQDYSSFSTNYNALGVKPLHSASLDGYPNNDKAGTPENFKSYALDGATNADWSGTTSPSWTLEGTLNVMIAIYNPSSNTIVPIQGAANTQSFSLLADLNEYDTSWGSIDQNQQVAAGETLVALVWITGSQISATLVYNSAAHPSGIDFPIEVPEDSLSLAGVALIIPFVAGLALEPGGVGGGSEEKGIRRIQMSLILAAALILVTLPLVMTSEQFLTRIVISTGLDKYISWIVPYEAGAVSALLRGFGLHSGSSASNVWIGGSFLPLTAYIDWNCAGWQSFILLGITAVLGLSEIGRSHEKVFVLTLGIIGVFALNILRIFLVVLLGYFVNFQAAIVFHNYGGAIMTMAFLLAFWTLALSRFGKEDEFEIVTVA